ncbi:MAG TPA: DUF1684 domain-containing protein [Candidatus Kryptobacter bacterium]|nr:DUF1684 domain-containing protein [Candidatus Kryptobacter bacterium]
MKTATKVRIPLLLLLALSIAACSGKYKRVTFGSAEKQSYLEQLNRFRERKDLFFRSDLSSPLTQAQRATFHQLNYYPPNFDLIFRVKLLKEGSPKQIGIHATGGETRTAVKYGRFEFDAAGKELSLYVYKMAGDDSNELFVPFTDETCGKTSYSGGRYIDLNQNESGEYVLDFNYAYNPYCGYNHNYSCPIVPQENHLDAPIEAGEMKY